PSQLAGSCAVRELRRAICHHEPMRRLDVSMHNALRMHITQRRDDRQEHRQQLAKCSTTPLGETSSRGVLHHDPNEPTGSFEVLDAQNVRMAQPMKQRILALQGGDSALLADPIRMQQLERDVPLLRAIARQPHLTAATAAEATNQDESARQLAPALEHATVRWRQPA